MNLISGWAFAALIVSPPAANPTVTMMSYFWSTNDWMFLPMSADTALVAALAVPPIFEAPSWAPSHEYWLKFLSSRDPTSVTRPIFGPPAAALEPPLEPAPEPHAAATRDSPVRRTSPIERVRMFPPLWPTGVPSEDRDTRTDVWPPRRRPSARILPGPADSDNGCAHARSGSRDYAAVAGAVAKAGITSRANRSNDRRSWKYIAMLITPSSTRGRICRIASSGVG